MSVVITKTEETIDLTYSYDTNLLVRATLVINYVNNSHSVTIYSKDRNSTQYSKAKKKLLKIADDEANNRIKNNK